MSDPSEPLSDEWFDNLVAKMPYDDGGVGAVVRAVAAVALRWGWERCVRVGNTTDEDSARVLADVMYRKMTEIEGER